MKNGDEGLVAYFFFILQGKRCLVWGMSGKCYRIALGGESRLENMEAFALCQTRHGRIQSAARQFKARRDTFSGSGDEQPERFVRALRLQGNKFAVNSGRRIFVQTGGRIHEYFHNDE